MLILIILGNWYNSLSYLNVPIEKEFEFKNCKNQKKINTVKREKQFKLPQRNILWENGIIKTINYAGILVFVKNRAVSEKSVTEIFHLWSRILAISDEIIPWRTNMFNEIWYNRKQFAFAHDKHWRITNCWYGIFFQFFFKLTPWLGNRMLY